MNVVGQKLPLQIVYPDCQHLKGTFCTYLTNRLGRMEYVSPVFCQHACPKMGGAHCKPHADNDEQLIYNLFEYRLNVRFLKKIFDKYDSPVEIHLTDRWPQIKTELEWVYDWPGIQAIALTGSLLIKDQAQFKDYDIAFIVDDLDAFVPTYAEFRETLPRQIGGIDVDYFFLPVWNEVFFAILDPENKVLYQSAWRIRRSRDSRWYHACRT